jgi:16S rRNA (cytidine1402-2'-O)-methyltransferase
MEIKPALYVVGTPIGNLGDMSRRAAHVLANVDFIAAEDTRVTGKLLKSVIPNSEARTPSLISYHEHNAVSRGAEIIVRLKAGESCAIVTDAGMPCISDPGELLVQECYANEIPVYAVPGACAVTAALAVSGLSTRRFCFEGFLPPKKRAALLESLRELPHTLVFYESPHKLMRTLADLLEHFGDRKIALCRELTKLYEEVLRGRISEFIAAPPTLRGEFAVVVEGYTPPRRVKVNKYPRA